MGGEDICIRLGSGAAEEYIRSRMNHCTVSYVKRICCESGLPEEVQRDMVDKIIEYVKLHIEEARPVIVQSGTGEGGRGC